MPSRFSRGGSGLKSSSVATPRPWRRPPPSPTEVSPAPELASRAANGLCLEELQTGRPPALPWRLAAPESTLPRRHLHVPAPPPPRSEAPPHPCEGGRPRKRRRPRRDKSLRPRPLSLSPPLPALGEEAPPPRADRGGASARRAPPPRAPPRSPTRRDGERRGAAAGTDRRTDGQTVGGRAAGAPSPSPPHSLPHRAPAAPPSRWGRGPEANPQRRERLAFSLQCPVEGAARPARGRGRSPAVANSRRGNPGG